MNPKTLSEVFIKAPAPKKPTPVIIAPNKDKLVSPLNSTEIMERTQEPIATNVNVPNPTGLCDLWLSNPNRTARKKVKRSLNMAVSISIRWKQPDAF